MKNEVSLNFIDVILPLALPKTYTYSLAKDEAATLRPGFLVAVPFGKQKIYTAVVKRVHQVAPQTYEPKSIVMILDDAPVITPDQLKFWEWISEYYMCTQGEVLRASLPAALLIESQSSIVKCEATQEQLDSLSDSQFLIYEALQKQNLTLEEISKITDRKHVMPLIVDMIEKKVALIHQRLEEKFKPKKVRVVQLEKKYQQEKKLQELFDDLERAPKQKRVLMALLSEGKALDRWHEVSQ